MWMQREVDLCRSRGIAYVLLVSPVDFQLFYDAKAYAQDVLRDFASRNGIPDLDILRILNDQVVQELQSEQQSSETDEKRRRRVARRRSVARKVWGAYFIDFDHYRPEGHRLVAEHLFPIVMNALSARGAGIEGGASGDIATSPQ